MLSFDHVTKFYGPVIGVNDITFQLEPGVTGLLGANGAGKTTLIKLASGQLRPTQGKVRVGGRSAWSTRAKRHLGYSPDIDAFYEEMKARDFVYSVARLYGYPRSEAAERAQAALEMVGMAQRSSRRLAGCSHGMRQRIKLAQALLHDPDLLLLDEPLNGVDPGGRRDLQELLLELAQRGKTILVSSHILVEVEQLTDRILMMARGRIVAEGVLGDIRRLLANRPLTIEIVAQPVRRLAAALVERADVAGVEVHQDTLRLRTTSAGDVFARVAELAATDGVVVQKMQSIDEGAEAVFEYIEKGAP